MNFDLSSLFQSAPFNDNSTLKILVTLIIFSIAWGVNWFIPFVLSKKMTDSSLLYSWKKTIFYTTFLIVLVILGRIWLQGFQPFITLLSIVAAALTITQKESLMNMVGSILILWRELFMVGDRIQVEKFRGDVVGFGIFYFTLIEVSPLSDGEQSTGKMIKVPNGLVLTNPIINYTKIFPYVWNELHIGISQDSNWKKAKEIMLEMGEKHTKATQIESQDAVKRIPKDEFIILGKLSPIVYIKQKIDYNPVGFILQLRFLCHPRKHRDTEQLILEDALTQFAEENDIYLIDMSPSQKPLLQE